MAARVYRCSLCGLAFFDDQLPKDSRGRASLSCPQDKTKLRDITKTERGYLLLYTSGRIKRKGFK